ncbi:hypothetical protein PHYSODRAFT_331641 [Phytophthora sojae]|uniref:Uncharacterized protein n=1 Tax=Phytophthora sojae (strain P6497) TaxID=1094619 RepID=G4ZIP9_PHYSP|nr:hypothetical protein PHYSODRAFT_331641 [Phytophthora sojae]EGZ17710.1 hypothetical protein PHYSODRAFT_331641 [Phytophthora sojae]|eukprot:XP_009526768.1 hypothetical protein PHYSODRAFT_331641 [Phytophthora sojae]
MVLVDLVGSVSAVGDTDAMVAGDSGSKHNGGRNAVCAVNSMVSEASAATVAVLDVSGRVGRDRGRHRWHGHERDGGIRLGRGCRATVAVLDVIGGVSAGMVTNATVAFGSGSERNDSGSPHAGCRRATMSVQDVDVDVYNG